MAIRLKNYATKRLNDYGFPIYNRCVVEKIDGYYRVDFVNNLKGSIGINGILIGKGGWPTLDHGFNIDTNQHT